MKRLKFTEIICLWYRWVGNRERSRAALSHCRWNQNHGRFFGFLLGHVNLLALPPHQHTSFLCPDVSDRIALSFFKERKGGACRKLLPATVHQATVIPSTQETRKHPDAAKSWRPGTRRSEVCVFNNYRRSLSGWHYSSHTKGTQTARDQGGWTSAAVGLVAATEFNGQGWAVRWDWSRVSDQLHGLWRHLHRRDRSNDTSSVFRAQVTRKMQTDWPFSRSGSCASWGTQDEFRQPCSPRQRQA